MASCTAITSACSEHFLARLLTELARSLACSPLIWPLWLKLPPAAAKNAHRERTSWSCHHGVMRWMGRAPARQADGSWKAQLRYAFECLAGELDHLYRGGEAPYRRSLAHCATATSSFAGRVHHPTIWLNEMAGTFLTKSRCAEFT